MFAWEALCLVDAGGIPLPQWTTEYLFEAAAEMADLSRSTILETKIAPAVYKAVGFNPKRGSNPFRALTEASHDFHVCLEVWTQLQQGKQLTYAIDAVIEDHAKGCPLRPPCDSISRATVGRLWRQHRDCMPL